LLSKVISGSTKVIDFDTNRKRVYDFVLVINSNLCRISHRFGDTTAYWLKIANSYPPHPHLTPLLVGPPIPTTYSNTGISVFKKINTGIPVLILVLMNEI